MVHKTQPTEYEISGQIDISATPEQVFAVIDPGSPSCDLRQKGCYVEPNPDVQDSYFSQHPESFAEYCGIGVSERKVPERLVLDVERFSDLGLAGYLLGSNSVYELSPSDTGGTTLKLSDRALFHPEAKDDDLKMEHKIYSKAIQNHLEKVRSYCEIAPHKNEHHLAYRMNEFWEWFVDNEEPLRKVAGVEDKELLVSLAEQLQLRSAYLSFEIRTLDDGLSELAIHSDGMKVGFSAVEQMVSLAPIELLPTWRVVAFKQPKGQLGNEGFVSSGSFDPSSIRYTLKPVNEYGTRDITLFFDTYTESSTEAHMEQGFFVLDHCLGEYRTATEIGEIELQALTKAGDSSKPIHSLVEEFV